MNESDIIMVFGKPVNRKKFLEALQRELDKQKGKIVHEQETHELEEKEVEGDGR